MGERVRRGKRGWRGRGVTGRIIRGEDLDGFGSSGLYVAGMIGLGGEWVDEGVGVNKREPSKDSPA